MKLRQLLIALAAMFTLLPAFTTAQAQTNIIVMDTQRILVESKAGKDMAQKLKNIEEQMQKELKPTGDSLKTEGEKIQKEWSQLSELALRQNTTLQEKRKSWERRLQEFDAKSKKRAVEFQLTQRDASGKYNKALSAALDEVIAESKADLVLERSTVVRMDDSHGQDR